ncbi:hypothetical protein NUSPORA_01941 [Nucleospora cyclopteri]
MNINTLRDRRNFLIMQHEKLTEKLNKFITENEVKLNDFIKKDHNISEPDEFNNLQRYLIYKCDIGLESIDKSINLRPLIFNGPKSINISEIEKMLRLRFVLLKFIHQINSNKQATVNLQLINANRIIYATININDISCSFEDSEKKIIEKISYNFSLPSFINLERVFSNKFTFQFDENELNEYLEINKVRILLEFIKKEMLDAETLQRINSYIYYKKYNGFSKFINGKTGVELIIDFLDRIDENYVCLVLNFLIQISVDLEINFSKYANYPNSYFISWKFNK